MTFKQQAKALVEKMTMEEKLSQMNFDAPAIERLGIPSYNWWNECLHGVARNGTATVFPQAIALAATFNKDMMFKVATAISDEIRAKYNEHKKQGFTDIYQGITACSPNINIFRDPRWGRGHETYGEDPTLTGMMGAEYVKGLQGNGKYRKVAATLKHYAVHSGPEGIRHGFNVDIDDKDLYETYLKAFAYCIENANPAAVMGAYNAVNGEPCTASPTMLNKILRDKLGFKGFVESDAGAVEDIHDFHFLTKTAAESAALSVNGGCDLCLGYSYNHLMEAYEKGWVTEERINEAVTRLFEERFRLGMFADDCEYDNIPYDVVDCKAHAQLNLQMAREGIVLLKNKGNILPLQRDAKIALIGPAVDDRMVLIGNYSGRASTYVTIVEGIKSYSKNVLVEQGCDYWKEPNPWQERMYNEALIVAKKSDIIVLCMGLNPNMEGEDDDSYSDSFSGDKKSIQLPKIQRDLYNKLKALGKPIVFVNVSGSCIALGEQKRDCDAVLQCFYSGSLGGQALADVLFGACSPCGRLPVTFYGSDDDLPDFEDYSMKNRTYKFFTGTPVFAFGEGLTYSEIKEEWLDENMVKIRNVGKYDTWYSVLQYEYLPYKSLKDFTKIFIKAGETKTVRF